MINIRLCDVKAGATVKFRFRKKRIAYINGNYGGGMFGGPPIFFIKFQGDDKEYVFSNLGESDEHANITKIVENGTWPLKNSKGNVCKVSKIGVK